MGSNLPDPTNGAVLSNLLTLHVNPHCCTIDVFRSTPKLKKLGIKIELRPDSAEILSCFEHIGLLDELKSLKCVVLNPWISILLVFPPDDLSNLPRSLKKLSLKNLGYSWKFMRVIGLLPNLQVLKLQCFAFQGKTLETPGGEFQRLNFLLLEDIDLVRGWKTKGDDCFPSLERLIIRHYYKLKEIPLQIGAIQTLKAIELLDCNHSAVASVYRIQKEEWYYGNYALQVVITSSWNL